MTVATVEDQRGIRDELVALLEETPGVRCSGAYRSMEEALHGFAREAPDVALMDIGLPGMSGIDGIRAVRERHPDVRILMLTVYDDNDRIFEALCAGACGYLLKKTPPDRLIEGIRDAVDGGAPMSPEVAARVLAAFRLVPPPQQVDYDLTPHEIRLLKLMAEGHTYKSAAAILRVTAHTVSFHLRKIYEKLEVHTKSEAVAKALKFRLV